MPTGHDQDVVELLMTQHNRIKELIEQVKTAAPDAKREPFEDLVRLLAVHEAAEEEVVHPTARRTAGGEEIVDARLHEEEKAKKELAELYDLGVAHRDFDERFRAFADKVIDIRSARRRRSSAGCSRSPRRPSGPISPSRCGWPRPPRRPVRIRAPGNRPSPTSWSVRRWPSSTACATRCAIGAARAAAERPVPTPRPRCR